MEPQQGYVNVNGGKIWYRVTDGGIIRRCFWCMEGRGFASYYLNPLRALIHYWPVIQFDLLGCGRSDKATNTSLFTHLEQIKQIKQLLTHLKVKDFYLYGHSCGAALAAEYYLMHHEGVKGLVLASPFLSANLWR